MTYVTLAKCCKRCGGELKPFFVGDALAGVKCNKCGFEVDMP